jgi:hypothetical protein
MPERPSAAAVAGVVGISILAAGDSANFYSGMLPSLFTISSDFFHGQGSKAGNVRRIRQGEAAATALSLTVGLGASLVVQNWLPLLATGATCAVLVCFYEYALRHPASQES